MAELMNPQRGFASGPMQRLEEDPVLLGADT